jgi:hypothetical protein
MAAIALIIMTFIMGLLAPMFTLGCVLIYYGHPILGGILVVLSLFVGILKTTTNN